MSQKFSSQKKYPSKGYKEKLGIAFENYANLDDCLSIMKAFPSLKIIHNSRHAFNNKG